MLTFLRHGETKWNREGRIQGTLDILLSTHGRQCVQRYAEKHRSSDVHMIWTSPLGRARETAVILAARLGTGNQDVPVRELVPLIERHYGIYQGQRLDDLEVRLCALKEELIHGEGVETWCDLQQRVLEALRILAAGPDQALVVVHGGWLKAMHWLLRTGLDQQSTDNLSTFSVERSKLLFSLNKLNPEEVCHEQSLHN